MDIYEDLLSRDAKLIPGGAAQNTARGAQVSKRPFQYPLKELVYSHFL